MVLDDIASDNEDIEPTKLDEATVDQQQDESEPQNAPWLEDVMSSDDLDTSEPEINEIDLALTAKKLIALK